MRMRSTAVMHDAGRRTAAGASISTSAAEMSSSEEAARSISLISLASKRSADAPDEASPDTGSCRGKGAGSKPALKEAPAAAPLVAPDPPPACAVREPPSWMFAAMRMKMPQTIRNESRR
jgi:hypothetical protein